MDPVTVLALINAGVGLVSALTGDKDSAPPNPAALGNAAQRQVSAKAPIGQADKMGGDIMGQSLNQVIRDQISKTNDPWDPGV